MPQRVFCDRCGVILYDGLELRPPSEIVLQYNGTCPKCEKTLSYEPQTVRILPYEGIRRPPPLGIRRILGSG